MNNIRLMILLCLIKYLLWIPASDTCDVRITGVILPSAAVELVIIQGTI